jgi:hypothetical protein
MRDRWRTVARGIVVVALVGCGSPRPDALGDPLGGPDSSAGNACANPSAMGCPCAQVGQTAACGEVVEKTGTYVTCSMGNVTCDGNTWGPCLGNTIVSKSLAPPAAHASSGLHFTSLGTGGACPAGTNPCDPSCNQTSDDPTTGFVPPAGFATGPSGLVLSGSSTVPCTSLTVTPSSNAVTVTSLTTPGTITLTATAVPAGCATSPYPTTWTIDDVDQSTITGTNNNNGVLTLQTPLPGTTNVTAYAAGTSGTAVITITLDIVDPNGIAPDTASNAAQYGKFYVGGVTSAASLAGTTASTASWLYPYANTYFPLALPAPVVMYKYAATPSGTAPKGAVKLSLRYPAGTTEAASTFNYATIITEPTPDPQVYVNQTAWQRFEQTARGNDASLVIQRWTGGGGGVLENETLRTIHFVNGQLKGTVFYNSYSSPQGNNTGAVLSIAPGATAPTLAVQPTGQCTVCHSLNLDGSKLIANGGGLPGTDWFNQSKRWNMAGGGAPSPPILNNYGYSNSPPGNDNDAVGDKFTFGAPRTDGSLYMTHGGSGTGDNNWRAPASFSNLYDPSNPATAKVVTGWPANMEAVTPKFSPDGAKLAFGFWGGSVLNKSSGTLAADTSGKTLAVVDFTCNAGCTSGWTVANARAVTTAASPSPSGLVGWPSFLPDASAVIYQHQIVNSDAYLGWSPSSINTVAGAQADLWISNVPANGTIAATPTRLNALNGLTAAGANYLPTSSRTVAPHTAYHTGGINIPFHQADFCGNSATAINVYDYQLNYLPAVNPTQAGGLNWVVFTSRRMYGNIAYDNPWDADPNQLACTSGTPPTKKLWVAAVDGTFTPGTDPSHPAFYLPGQELAAGNSNGYWVNTPCAAVGSSCGISDDCCGGSGGSPTTTCKITTAPTTKTCQPIGGACVAAGGVCNTAGSPGDCCNGLTCPGVGGTCFNPTSIVYTPQTYTREFIGTCPSGTKAVWRFFQWQSTIPANTSVAFSAQTKQLVTDTYAPAVALGIGSATTTTPSMTWAHGPLTVDDTLIAAGLVSKAYLLVTMKFTPNAAGTATPALSAWQQLYDCVPAE